MSEVKSESAKKNEDWMNTKWRPMMGWMYMLVCTADFVIFPVLWSVVQVIGDGKVETQWNPITLQGAGLFHMAMGAILGIAVYGRTKEKLEGATSTPATPTLATPAPAFGNVPLGNNAVSSATTFGSKPVVSTPAPAFGTAPVQPPHPEI
jgi:hypothetical protein